MQRKKNWNHSYIIGSFGFQGFIYIEIIKIFQKYMIKCQNLMFLPQNNCLGVVDDNIFVMYIVFVRNEAML